MRLTIAGTVLGLVAALAAIGVPLQLPETLAQFRASIEPRWNLVAIASDLVQAYAILAGLIVQVITLVALAFSPGRLGTAKVRRVVGALDRMQEQLLALFAVYVATLALSLGTKLSIDAAHPPSSRWVGLWLAATSFMVMFSLARTAEMGRSILSVHRLRGRMLVLEVEEEGKSDAPLPVEPDPSPEAYGSKTHNIDRRAP